MNGRYTDEVEKILARWTVPIFKDGAIVGRKITSKEVRVLVEEIDRLQNEVRALTQENQVLRGECSPPVVTIN